MVASLPQAIEQATEVAQQKLLDTIWVIGGERMFRESLNLANRLEITHVATIIDNATAFYPSVPQDFIIVSEGDNLHDEKAGLSYQFVSYVRS